MTTPTSHAWVAVLDQKHALLLRGRLDDKGRAHLEPVDRIENRESPREHARASPLGGKTSHAYAAWPHETEELRDRHARRVSRWLTQALQTQAIERLHIFAPAPLLGAVRRHLPVHGRTVVESREGEFTNLGLAELARQAAILAALAAGDGSRQAAVGQ